MKRPVYKSKREYIETRLAYFQLFIDTKDNPDECWLWTGSVSKGGYGLWNFEWKDERVSIGAHRLNYMVHNKVMLDPSQILMHSCDTPRCCNPNHLTIGTYAENAADRNRKGRTYFVHKEGFIHCPHCRQDKLPHNFPEKATFISNKIWCGECLRKKREAKARKAKRRNK